jgi:hypothetical protein
MCELTKNEKQKLKNLTKHHQHTTTQKYIKIRYIR